MALGGDPFVPALVVGGIGLFLVGAGLREAYLAVRLWRVRPVPIAELDRATGRSPSREPPSDSTTRCGPR